jgi:uncharacterized protein
VNSGDPISIDFSKSRRVLICGKTGSGKSYTLGVLIEELRKDQDSILLVVDPQGIFWTMAQPNYTQEAEIYAWGEAPQGLPVNVLVPGDPLERYGGQEIVDELSSRGVQLQSLRLNPSDITEEMWCDLFNLDINELQGITLSRAVRNARQKLKRDFFISDIIEEVKRTSALDTTKEAAIRKLEMAADWEIFETVEYREIFETLMPAAVNVLDLSTLDQGRYGLRNLVVAVLARLIFRQRTIARRAEALALSPGMPRVWMAIDEAQNFAPTGRSTLSKEILIRWAKEGRQPGLSLVLATQQPGAIDAEILSQCDLRIVHKITSREDLKAINALSEEYMDREIQSYIRELDHVGEAILIDDKKECVERVRVRPRTTEHGGDGK